MNTLHAIIEKTQIVRVLSKYNDRSVDGMFVFLKFLCTCKFASAKARA